MDSFVVFSHMTSVSKKYITRKNVAKYLYDQLTGNFAGFVVGLSATGLVSRFFETRSIRNLWGIASKKTVVSKDAFSALEWIISIVIGFIVFEIMTRVVKEKLDRLVPTFKIRVYRWLVRNEFADRYRAGASFLSIKRVVMLSSFNAVLRKTFSRSSGPV
jgi:hypothetical protein